MTATYSSQTADAKAERLILDRFHDQLTNLVVRHGEANFELPHDPRQLGRIMSVIESLMESPQTDDEEQTGLPEDREAEILRSDGSVFTNYTISEPNMEMIFMNVYMKAGTESS